MPYYIASTLLFLAASLFGGVIKAPRFWIVMGLIPMVFLALCRGKIGADTAVYLQSIEQIVDSGTYLALFEPLFEGLVLAISVITTDAKIILILLGALVTGVLLKALYGRIDPFMFCIFIVPVYYFDMVMNGVRYGLSFVFVLLASHYLVEGKQKTFFLLVVVASMFQISGGILGFLLYLVYAQRWKWIVYFGVIGSVAAFLGQGYILAKFNSYVEIQTTSIFSGLSTLIVSSMMLAVWLLDVNCRNGSRFAVFALFALSILMFGLSQVSYAGIRLLQLINFLIILYFSACLASGTARLSIVSKACFVFVGIIAFMFRMKNFSDGAGIGESPFVPYLFFWE